jgi:PAS domain S-box-containing protein
MHPAIVSSAMAAAAAVLMAGWVVSRPDRSSLHRLLFGLSVSLAVWTLGNLSFFLTGPDGEFGLALRTVLLGVIAVPLFWLLLALRYVRGEGADLTRPTIVLAAPSAVAVLALLTNDHHHWILSDAGFDEILSGGKTWAGPGFFAFMGWSYACVVASIALYIRSLRGRNLASARRRIGLLISASVIPLLTGAVYVFRLAPVSFDLTPAGLFGSLALIWFAVIRYRFLESLPLARRDVIEHLRDGVVMASPTGIVLDFNPAAERILGVPGEQLRRRSLVEVLEHLVAEDPSSTLVADLEAMTPGSAPLVAELALPDRRIVELTVAWVSHASGEPAGRYCVLRDRTQARRYERVARHAQKLQTVGTLATGIAHEVNNPLAFIRANLAQIRSMGEWVEICAASDGEDAKLAHELIDLRPIADETADGIARIEQIVSGMRHLVTTRENVFRFLSVEEVVRDAVQLSNLAGESGISFSLVFEEGLPRVDGVPDRLVQALLNLLVNARQALAGSGGTISLDVRAGDSHVEIRVADDGPGIPPEIQDRIFDPFFTTRDPDEGMGLGLAIAFDILQDHGGLLEVHSEPGRGAIFTASLPRATESS